VVPSAFAGTTGAVPYSGADPINGIRTVTIADITDFHGHIERGADNATAFTLADSHNPGNMVPVSTGDLVGGSPYESAAELDQPTLDMAKDWGLTVSAVGNHEFDRGVADFNGRIASPGNGIDWLCANTSTANKANDGKLSRVKDYTIRTVNGKRVGFVGALTDALGSVATPQITKDADLDERGVDAINRVAGELRHSGKVDAVVALLHADAAAAADIGSDVDLIYTGHSHAIKRAISAGGAPIIEAGSFGRQMAVQDLVITGSGRHAKVQVTDVDLGNGTSHASVNGVLNVEGLGAHPTQAAWMSAGAQSDGMVTGSQRIYAAAKQYAANVGGTVVGTVALGSNFDKHTAPDREGSIGMLVADANREAVIRHIYAGDRIAVVGFSNDGSLRTERLDMDGDGKVTVREVDSLMALQFVAAHETMTGRGLKSVLAQQFRVDDGALKRRWLGVSSNVDYRYVACGGVDDPCAAGGAGDGGNGDANAADAGASPAGTGAGDANAGAAGANAGGANTSGAGNASRNDKPGKAAVDIVDLSVDGKAVDDDDLVIIASNSYLLQGGDSYSAFLAGNNYGELDMSYSQPLIEYLANRPALSATGGASGARV
jgi:2',3'-cyclic-nucleotide 2'-phosphodiesterase (5'-nucleotidase family)